MDNNKGFDVSITYKERSTIGATKRVEESVFLEIRKDSDFFPEDVERFKKTIKKSFSLFNKNSIWDLNIEFYYGNYWDYSGKRRFSLIHQSNDDHNNGVYELYSYSLTLPETNITKVSKQIALKNVFAMIDKLINESMQEAA